MVDTEVTATWLAIRLADHIAAAPGGGGAAIEVGIRALIDSGELADGTKLPTIRSLADELDLKVSAVTDAWVRLRRDRLVDTRRRGGTFVTRTTPAAGPAPTFDGWGSVELVQALPEPALVPSTVPAFAASIDPGRPLTHTHLDAKLIDRLQQQWPFGPATFTLLPTGLAALRMILDAVTATADGAIAAESPGMLRTNDLTSRIADHPTVAVDLDADGPVPDSLKAALDAGAGTFVFQPAGQIPLGSTMTPHRRDALVTTIERHGSTPWIVEDDASAGLFPAISLGAAFPEHTVRISQYWRAFGTDLALSVVGGAGSVVGAILDRQRADGIRVSGLLQRVLTILLGDREALARARSARAVYDRLNVALTAALERRGLRVDSYGGLFVWIPVPDEHRVLRQLAGAGIRAQGGRDAFVTAAPSDHIRLSVTRLPHDPALLDDLAALLAAAVAGSTLLDVE